MNSIVMGLILGIIYYGQTDTQRSAKNIMGLFFLLMMFQTMVSMFGVLQVPTYQTSANIDPLLRVHHTWTLSIHQADIDPTYLSTKHRPYLSSIHRLYLPIPHGLYLSFSTSNQPPHYTSTISNHPSLTHLPNQSQAFPSEVKVFIRENLSGANRVSSYFLAKTISDLPTTIIYPIIFSSIVYGMVGLSPSAEAFYFYLVVVILIANCASGVGYMISSMTSHEAVAYALGK